MVLKLKNRKENPRKKILIYGLDGTGKSTFAETYCLENNLNPIVIDIDDTNFTGLDILELNFPNDNETYVRVKNTIKEIGKSDYDTIVLDGVSSLLEMLTSKARGQAKYSDRAMRWNDILFEIENTKKNIIFVGQIDCDMLWTEDYQPSKAIIKLNSLVNEKYKCFIDDKGNFETEVKKFRTLEQIESEAKVKKSEKVENVFESAKDYVPKKDFIERNAEKIIKQLQNEDKKLTLDNARQELLKLCVSKKVEMEDCEKIWKRLEVLLNG